MIALSLTKREAEVVRTALIVYRAHIRVESPEWTDSGIVLDTLERVMSREG